MFKNWKPCVAIIAGTYTNGDFTGKLSSADFGENEVEIYLGNGLFWRGTSQAFDAEWKRVKSKG